MRTGRRARDRLNQARLCGAAALVFVLSIGASVFAAMALAAPPSNDNFASAQTLAGPFPIVVRGTTNEATREPDEPTGGETVWYAWTAPANRNVTIETCGGTYLPPYPSVYTGSSLSDVREVGARDEVDYRSTCPLPDPSHDDPQDLYSVVEFEAIAGTTYRIQLTEGDFGGIDFGLVLRGPEVYDLAISQTVSRRRVPFGGAVNETLKVTNRGNIAVPVPQDPRLAFGQEINVPGQPHYPGKAIYAFARSPGGRCSHGNIGPTKIQSFACDVTRLAPGESQTAAVRIKRIRGSLLLDAHGVFQDDRRGNDDAQKVIRVRRRR